MNKLFHESLHCFKSTKIISLLIIFVVSISCFLSIFSFGIYQELKKDVADFSVQNIETQYYRLGDNFYNEYEQNLKASENYVAKLKNLYYSLTNATEFKYYEIYNNTVSLMNYIPNNKFLESYSSGDYETSIIRVDESLTVFQVNGIYLGNNVFQDFNLSLQDGDYFKKEHYNLENSLLSGEIPVILGSEYKEFYKIGDYIDACVFPVDEVKLKVIGFLETNSYVNIGNGYVKLLDRYIILPSFDFNTYQTGEEYTSIYRSLYYVKTDGVIACNCDANTIQKVINNICSDLDIFPYYYVIGATNQPSYFLGLDMETMLVILKTMVIFIISFSIIIVTIFNLITVKRNIKYYSILLVNGFTYNNIKGLILLQPIYIFSTSSVISFIIYKIISYYLRMDFYLEIFIFAFIALILISCLVGFLGMKSLNKYDISVHLRKR